VPLFFIVKPLNALLRTQPCKSVSVVFRSAVAYACVCRSAHAFGGGQKQQRSRVSSPLKMSHKIWLGSWNVLNTLLLYFLFRDNCCTSMTDPPSL
jgi:hypothetical protein